MHLEVKIRRRVLVRLFDDTKSLLINKDASETCQLKYFAQ